MNYMMPNVMYASIDIMYVNGMPFLTYYPRILSSALQCGLQITLLLLSHLWLNCTKIISTGWLLLGREHSHATGQSQGQSHTTEQYEQTKATERPGQTTGRPRDNQPNSQKVQSVMAPMAQPIGGWHVTSMTGRSRPTRPHLVTHDYTGPT